MMWIISSRSVFIFSTINDEELIYVCSFAFNFSNNMLILFSKCALTSVIERKITLAGDVCYKPPTTIRSHDLHAGHIRGAMDEIISYHESN
jgi:hypothetical protein